ncbi:potassium transporter TrkG [Marinobacterium aestuariivivens]|uniref:Potassium transporter TrkG n=1 Tax=Marinobacterium aestuariivivens TaxID=1698799 RepID=A0ABW2A6M4_9GAMM
MADPRAHALMRTVRPVVVIRYLALLLILLSLVAWVPALVAWLLGDGATALRYAVVNLLLLLVCVPLARLPEPERIERNEALSVTALLFLLTPLLMSYPLMASGLSWVDAWFEAVSGITTTGLTTLPSVEVQSQSFLFGRAWMQWYGGLGIGVLAVALFMGHQVTSKKLLASAGEEGRSTTARSYARQVLQVYLLLTLLGFLLIRAFHPDTLQALVLSLSAISTGGFSSLDASLADLPFAVQLTISLVACAGAISLPLYHFGNRRQLSRLLRDLEARALLVAIGLLSLTLSVGLFYWHSLSPLESARHGVLLALSAQSTTGFSSLDVATLDPVPKLLLILSMLVGGSTGSTAGGLKLIRLLILLRLIQLTLQRISASPRAVLLPRLGGGSSTPTMFPRHWCSAVSGAWSS